MGDHELVEPFGEDPTVTYRPPVAGASRTVEVKLVVASVLAAMLYALAQAVAANTAILDPLPEWARFTILAVLPTVLAFAGGYMKSSNRV